MWISSWAAWAAARFHFQTPGRKDCLWPACLSSQENLRISSNDRTRSPGFQKAGLDPVPILAKTLELDTARRTLGEIRGQEKAVTEKQLNSGRIANYKALGSDASSLYATPHPYTTHPHTHPSQKNETFQLTLEKLEEQPRVENIPGRRDAGHKGQAAPLLRSKVREDSLWLLIPSASPHPGPLSWSSFLSPPHPYSNLLASFPSTVLLNSFPKVAGSNIGPQTPVQEITLNLIK